MKEINVTLFLVAIGSSLCVICSLQDAQDARQEAEQCESAWLECANELQSDMADKHNQALARLVRKEVTAVFGDCTRSATACDYDDAGAKARALRAVQAKAHAGRSLTEEDLEVMMLAAGTLECVAAHWNEGNDGE